MNPADKLTAHISELKDRFKVRRLGVFGSFASGHESEKSDVDVLVEFDEPVDIFTFMELKEYLESLLGREVDLVTEKALKPPIREEVLKQVLYV